MTDRRIDVFFYGLFMDSEVLRGSHVVAVNPRRAHVDDFQLRIGRRATLVPEPGARAYGMVYAMTHGDLQTLYAGPGLAHYRPEAVLARLEDGPVLAALCYNLRQAPAPGEANADYAAQLRSVLGTLGFPRAYIETIT